MRTLHRLVYLSRMSPDFPRAPEDQEHEVGRIIQASIRNNRAADVTGLLLVRGDQFLQALEGPEDQVRATYDRIHADPRHGEVKVLESGPAGRRRFARWNMCARRASLADDVILDALQKGVADDLGVLPPAKALGLLLAVRNLQDRAMAEGLA